jgi:ribonucleoside-diphosphate reductase alpha chain
VKKFNLLWVEAGHVSGIQDHNVSCTVSIKKEEWDEVGEWMWKERLNYTGISVLPYDGHTYQQAPFEDCTKEVYEELFAKLKDIDLSQVVEEENNTNLLDQAACAGGACTIV